MFAVGAEIVAHPGMPPATTLFGVISCFSPFYSDESCLHFAVVGFCEVCVVENEYG